MNVSGTGNALDDETVTANNMLEVLAGAALTLDQGTSVANASGTVKVDATATLTLNNASITNGTVTNAGTINSAGGGVDQSGRYHQHRHHRIDQRHADDRSVRGRRKPSR